MLKQIPKTLIHPDRLLNLPDQKIPDILVRSLLPSDTLVSIRPLDRKFPSQKREELWNFYPAKREKLIFLTLEPIREYTAQFYSSTGRPAKNQAQRLRSPIFIHSPPQLDGCPPQTYRLDPGCPPQNSVKDGTPGWHFTYPVTTAISWKQNSHCL